MFCESREVYGGFARGSMRTLRITSGILFVCGLFFAWFAWVLIPTPIGIFLPGSGYQARDVILSITGSILAALGYFIWIGWLYFSINSRYPLLKYKTDFQVLVLVNHLGWLWFIPYMRRTDLSEFRMNLPEIFTWIILNIFVALISMLYFQRAQKAF